MDGKHIQSVSDGNPMPTGGEPARAAGRWRFLSGQVPGRSHLVAGIPCQDSSLAGDSPRPHVIVCDGRGSARMSERGAWEAAQLLSRQLGNLKPMFETVLDGGDEASAGALFPILAQCLCLTAAEGQKALAAATPGSTPADFEHTLIFIAAGTRRFMLVQVGDSAAVVRRHGRAETISEPMRGEYANSTFFVSAAGTRYRKVLAGMDGVDAFAACTDGAAERLIRNSDNAPAGAFEQFWNGMAAGTFDRGGLYRFLSEREWEPKVQDDRALAMIVRGGDTGNQSADSAAPMDFPALHMDDVTDSVPAPSIQFSPAARRVRPGAPEWALWAAIAAAALLTAAAAAVVVCKMLERDNCPAVEEPDGQLPSDGGGDAPGQPLDAADSQADGGVGGGVSVSAAPAAPIPPPAAPMPAPDGDSPQIHGAPPENAPGPSLNDDVEESSEKNKPIEEE